MLATSALTKLVLPAPEGAAMANRIPLVTILPLFIQCFGFVHAFVQLILLIRVHVGWYKYDSIWNSTYSLRGGVLELENLIVFPPIDLELGFAGFRVNALLTGTVCETPFTIKSTAISLLGMGNISLRAV